MSIWPDNVYDKLNEEKYRTDVSEVLDNTHKKNEDLIIRSPSNEAFTVGVDDDGYLTVNTISHSKSNKVLLWLSM